MIRKRSARQSMNLFRQSTKVSFDMPAIVWRFYFPEDQVNAEIFTRFSQGLPFELTGIIQMNNLGLTHTWVTTTQAEFGQISVFRENGIGYANTRSQYARWVQ